MVLSIMTVLLAPGKIYLLIPVWDLLQIVDLLIFAGVGWSPIF